MKMCISKYALTAGIEEAEGRVSEGGYFYKTEGSSLGYKVGRDAHMTRGEANAKAEAMRVKKIRSLKGQIKILEALRFTD